MTCTTVEFGNSASVAAASFGCGTSAFRPSGTFTSSRLSQCLIERLHHWLGSGPCCHVHQCGEVVRFRAEVPRSRPDRVIAISPVITK
jgi:hypothetical protein